MTASDRSAGKPRDPMSPRRKAATIRKRSFKVCMRATYLSISPRTMSSEASVATKSWMVSPGASSGRMPMLTNDGERRCMRYGFVLPSLTM